MTKDGIEYNLSISPYVARRTYGNIMLSFVFSSELYLNKFLKDSLAISEKNSRNAKLLNMDLHFLSDIYFYSQVEKRGFLIIKNDKQEFYSLELMNIKVSFDII